ncbi:uncharacterized protein LOC108909276 [Anoplophora glabripennis]|nr:uncharacterized protein LOC108909276 [Anoplophora glabripennis]
MNTPITISSTSTAPNNSDFVQLNYSSRNNEESVISLGSTSLERVPVSWTSRGNTFKRRDSNTSISNIQKVSNWIKSIEEPRHVSSAVVDLEDDVKDGSFKESAKTETPKDDFSSDSKSVILFRCDFNKSAKTYYPPLAAFGRSSSLISCLKNDKSETVNSCVTSISSKSDPTGRKPGFSNEGIGQTNLLLKRSDSSKIMNHYTKHNINVSVQKEILNDAKSNGSSEVYEVPLSPESRKKELCSYLQLMNPADKKERFILQNRRSTRVRNLTAMQEKRKMNDKVSESGDSEQLVKDAEKCPTLKSFRELNIRVEKAKFNDELFKNKISEAEADVFCFPFPSKELTENVEDFDNTMTKLISRYKRICRIKNLKVSCKIGLTKNVPKTKENLVKRVLQVKRKVGLKENNVKKEEHKFKDLLKKKYRKPMTAARINSLRSTGKFKNVSLKKLIGKKEKELNRKSIRKSVRENRDIKKRSPQSRKKSLSENSRVETKLKPTSPQCEIVTIPKSSEDSYIDIENLMDDMIDFNNLSEEHKKCLIENRILSTKPTPRETITSVMEEPSNSFYSLQEMSPLYGFNKTGGNEVKMLCEVYKNSVLGSGRRDVTEEYLLNIDAVKSENRERDDAEYKTDTKTAIEKLVSSLPDSNFEYDLSDNELIIKNEDDDKSASYKKHQLTNGITLQEHDYAGVPSDDELEEEAEVDITVPNKKLIVRKREMYSRIAQKKTKFQVLPYNKSVEMKSLHRSLQHVERKTDNSLADQSFTREWDPDNSPKQKSKKQSHYISIEKQNGAVLKAFYIDFNLIVCQEKVISFWMQTPLGNVLGSQNMWIPRGQTQRLYLNGKCLQKESMEMIIAMETHVAYVELWTKEHKSDIREGPVADVFATVYFWKQRQSGLSKKVLQLENINGFADDVQYSVMKSVPKIIVSWHSAHDDGATKRTFIHAYEPAADYQTVANIYNIEPVDHYVSSLHNIEDCDDVIMGCGENKITLWNVEYGYIIATVVLSEIKSPLSTLWVKCDRGFLFALQQCVDRELRLIAINGLNHSWKKLASYVPPEGFDRLRGVCIENGLLLSFYDQGILCWKAETGEPVEETSIESDIIPSGKYVILIEDEQILVKHAMTHLMSLSVEET